MTKALRIAVTVDPYIPVPPVHYGGIERVVDFLVRGLTERGHRVTLFAHPESKVLEAQENDGAGLIPYGVPPHAGLAARATELWQVGARLWAARARMDVIHSFGRLAALLPVLPRRSLVKIQSYQRDLLPWSGIRRARSLAGDSLRFTACASHMYQQRAGCGDWTTVFNGVDLDKYDFVERLDAKAPLVFLGRLEPVKGAHHAIAIARRAGKRLILAGNRVETGDSVGYFENRIAPAIDDRVTYLGPVDDQQKNQLLGSAAALLMPIEWDEPFGIVMAEALACGTPVIGFRRGSVGEVVREGVNGFSCSDVESAAALVARIGEIDRAAVRADAEARFSAETIVDAYEKLYRRCLERTRGSNPALARGSRS